MFDPRPMRDFACKTANKDSNGKCLGYSSGGDDEPIDRCKTCLKYTGHEEE
ncbi:MAG: hypothetical protein A4E53_01537 [Pelotomaculum sp. PtaB.Bin104]|nr:MAG: hypothetical protein A4E53_01537 [Pelotomaculum sp. PtaB.Bin104]